jgi:hypothetical protein
MKVVVQGFVLIVGGLAASVVVWGLGFWLLGMFGYSILAAGTVFVIGGIVVAVLLDRRRARKASRD